MQTTNDKLKCLEALESFINSLSQLDVFAELIEKTGINLLDIGAGDGSVAVPVLKILNRAGKAKYIGVERDNKFVPQIEEKFKSAAISCKVYPNDFRKIIDLLSKEQASIALASHLYTTTKMTEFLPMIFNLLNENGVIILVHNTAKSDVIKFRSLLDNLLKLDDQDYTKAITSTISQSNLVSITTTCESCFNFPKLIEEEWLTLKQIKQADYNNEYSNFSEKLSAAKNLIDFVISDKLEAFNENERNLILDKFKAFLIDNNYQFKSTCKIQVALSPKHTLECEKQFLQLKHKIEYLNEQPSNSNNLGYPGTLVSSFSVTSSQTQQSTETQSIGFSPTG